MPKDVNIGKDISRRNESSSTNILFFFFPRIYIDTWNKNNSENGQDLRVIIRGKVNTEEIVFISHAIIAWVVQYATGKLVEREKM